MKHSRIHWPLLIAAMCFWALETRFFGWNSAPLTIAELFADGLVLLMMALSLEFPVVNVSVNVNRYVNGEDER